LHDSIAAMLAELQPHSIVFNGNGLTANSVRWIGNERGDAPDPNWSTGISGDGGDPNSPIFCPAECDTTLQIFDRWFWVRK
jgi:alpha-L-fucosidase